MTVLAEQKNSVEKSALTSQGERASTNLNTSLTASDAKTPDLKPAVFTKANNLNAHPVSSQELQQEAEHGKEYLDVLSKFKSAGFEIKPDKGIVEKAQGDALLFQLGILGGKGDATWASYPSEKPADSLMYRYGSNFLMERELAPSGPEVDFPFFGAVTDRLEGGSKHLKIYNYLNPQSPLIYSAVIPADEVLDPKGQRANDIRKALYRNFRDTEERLDSLVVAGEAPAEIQIRRDLSRKADPQTLETLRKLSLLDMPPDFNTVPNRFASDHSYSTGLIARPFAIRITPQMLESSNGHPIVINGDMQRLSMADSPQFDFDLKAGTVDGLKFSKHDVSESGTHSFVVRDQDSYGNYVTAMYSKMKNGHCHRHISVEFPGSHAPEDKRAPLPVNLDLTPFGYGKIENYFMVIPEPEIGNAGPYKISTNMEPESARQILADKSADIARGISNAEKLFGFKPGEAADNIRLMESARANAFFQRRNPRSTVIQDEFIKNADSLIATEVGQHETFHLIDNKFGWKLSGGNLTKLFKDINLETFKQINEESFYKLNVPAGHSQDNPSELAASLLNTLLAPGWQSNVEGFSADVRLQYLELLKGLRADISQIAEIGKGAPVFSILADRIGIIENLSRN